MPHACPTVRVVSPVSDDNPLGYIVINQADYDHTKHELWVDPAAEQAPSSDAPAGAGKRKARS